MYVYAKDISLPLLSNFDSTFWSEYLTNYARYDKIFNNRYKSFRYFNQDPYNEDNTIINVTTNFIDDVYGHLLLNSKKYSQLYELYRLNDIDLINDFYTEETFTGGRNINGAYVSGARTDSTSDVYGARQGVDETSIMAFNSTEYAKNNKVENNENAHTDTRNFTKGSQSDSDTRQETTTNRNITKGYKENPSKNIKEYLGVWNSYEFYEYIFRQIANELLLS